MPMKRPLRLAAFCAGLVLAAGAAPAHDSWLSPSRDAAAASGAGLELATGTRFPVQEFSQSPASVAQARCLAASGGGVELRPVREQANWLDMQAAMDEATEPLLACWATLHAAEIELQAPLVKVYLNEIRAPAAIRAAWADMQARGLPWRESYRKYARIELATAAGASPERRAAARRPAGLELEIVVLGAAPVAVGAPLEFQVLRGGRPLAGFPVELVSERSPLGIWRETDAQGMLRHRLPFGGRWLLRGVDLRRSTDRPGSWESRFVTLAFEAP